MNRFAKKGQLLFTGSSLMKQFPIAEYCLSAGLPVTVYNRGIGGTTTDDILRNIDTVLFDEERLRLYRRERRFKGREGESASGHNHMYAGGYAPVFEALKKYILE